MQDVDYILWSYCDSGAQILRVKALEAFTNAATFSGEPATHDDNPMSGENPVASMWLPVGTAFVVPRFFAVAMEQCLTRFAKHAEVVFPSPSDGKGLAASQKELGSAQKKGTVLGEFGSVSIVPTCTEWFLRVLQRRTLASWSCANPVDLSTCTYLRLFTEMYIGCYELKRASVSPLRLKEVIQSCRTTTAYEPVHFALLQKLTIALGFQGFCILRTICLYMLEQLSSYYKTFPTPHGQYGQCAIGPAAQAANLLITSAENGDLRKVR